jgi:two-component system chemotaxis sensor kinase CheA
MAIIEGMVVLANGERYIIPALSVEEVLKPEPQAFHTAGGGKGEMVMVRGRLLPLINLSRLFGGGGGKGRDGVVVVVESEGRRKAVVVDDLLGKQEVVIKSLGGALGQMKGLSGGAILGDGRVGLILDSAGLFHIAEHGTGPATKESRP